MSFKKRLFPALVAVVAISLASFASTASADFLSGSHPDVSSSSFDFTNISEFDVSTEEITSLFFGPGTADGNMLTFAPPNNFVSLSSDGEFAFQDGRLTVEISSNNGALFNGITIDEGGAYNVTGAGVAEALLVGFVVTPDGTFTDAQSFSQAGTGEGIWSLTSTYAFPATDRAILIIDNQLETRTRPGPNVAFIDKKLVKITVVPEPGTVGIFAVASLGGLVRRRR